jgi:hypothetical protein
MKIIANQNFKMNEDEYIKGDELINLTYDEISKLNEKGFIEPLGYEDLVRIKRELSHKKNKKEE